MKDKPLIIGGLVLILILVGLTVFLTVNKSSGTSSGSYIVSFLPVLIVFMVNKNKARNRNLTKNEKLVVIGAVALTLVLLVATILLT